VDYRFLDQSRFDAMVGAGELAEWAAVHGSMYGTPRREIEAAASRGEHVVLDIDVQGARQIRRSVPESVLVFVLPPSVQVLQERLARRGTEAPAQVAQRLRTELGAVREFDHVVVNDDLDRCVKEIRGIVGAEARRTGRAVALEGEVEQIRSSISRILQEQYANAGS
jgi:guanylate kinase